MKILLSQFTIIFIWSYSEIPSSFNFLYNRPIVIKFSIVSQFDNPGLTRAKLVRRIRSFFFITGQLCILIVRKWKERKNTNNLSLTTIQPWSVYTHRTMWKRACLRIYLDNIWPDLASRRHLMLLFIGVGATHSLECVENMLITFQIKKIRKDNMKILKRSPWSS